MYDSRVAKSVITLESLFVALTPKLFYFLWTLRQIQIFTLFLDNPNIDNVGWLDDSWPNCRLQRTLTFWVNETFLNSFLHNDMSNDLTKPKQVQNKVFISSENKIEIIVFSQIWFHFYWTNNSTLSFFSSSISITLSANFFDNVEQRAILRRE